MAVKLEREKRERKKGKEKERDVYSAPVSHLSPNYIPQTHLFNPRRPPARSWPLGMVSQV